MKVQVLLGLSSNSKQTLLLVLWKRKHHHLKRYWMRTQHTQIFPSHFSTGKNCGAVQFDDPLVTFFDFFCCMDMNMDMKRTNGSCCFFFRGMWTCFSILLHLWTSSDHAIWTRTRNIKLGHANFVLWPSTLWVSKTPYKSVFFTSECFRSSSH